MIRKSILLLSAFILLFSANLLAQNIVSVTPVGSSSKDAIGALFGVNFIQYGAKYYKVDYTSVDAKGQPDTLSGLLSLPDNQNSKFPVLVYEHGTANCKTCVPSRYSVDTGGAEGEVGLLFAGMGYISILPDYVGMGDGRGFQSFVQYSTTVSATKDMLTAVTTWLASQNFIHKNKQLFITGYSQGGYSAMAFNKYLQSTFGNDTVTAAAFNSGPFSLSGVMKNLILADTDFGYPAYVPNTVLGLNEVYNIYPSISDFFKPAYVPDILQYYNGQITLDDLNTRILDTLVAQNGDSVTYKMINDNVVDSLANNPTYPFNQYLRLNDVFRWAPQTPTRIFYCKADDHVPYRNSIVAIDTMYARGANPSLVKAVDVDSTLGHVACITPAFIQTILFFTGYQSVTPTGINQPIDQDQLVQLYPNPVTNQLYFKGSPNSLDGLTATIYDLSAKLIINNQPVANGINLSHLSDGVYIVKLRFKNGAEKLQKIVVQKN